MADTQNLEETAGDVIDIADLQMGDNYPLNKAVVAKVHSISRSGNGGAMVVLHSDSGSVTKHFPRGTKIRVIR